MNEKSAELLGNKIEDSLFQFILSEPIEVGQKIPNEFQLASLFGVGRSTIREAVKALVSKGILEVRRGSGTFVVSTTLPEQDPLGLGCMEDKYKLALELFDVRLMIEPEIAALACDYATDEDIAELKKLCGETEELYKAGKNHIPKDIEFHTHIAKCSNNRVIQNLIPIINSAVLTFANLTQRMLMEETISTHRAVMQAIENRDSVGARCAMIMHLTYNRQMIIRLLEERISKTEK